MAFTVEIDTRELQLASKYFFRLAREMPEAGREVIREVGTRIRKYARDNANKRIYPRRSSISEDLAKSIYKRTGKDFVSIQVLASYGAAMETGTQPHFEPNHPWFSQRMHPGAQGYPIQGFMRRAVNRGMTELNPLAREVLNKRLGKIQIKR